MELTVEIIIISLLLLGFLWEMVYIFRQKARLSQLDSEIVDLKGSRNADINGSGKFSELGLMSAGIAHELSNPLMIIQGRLIQLERTYRDPSKEKETAQGLQQIKYASERIGKIIENLRQYIYRDELQEEADISLSEVLESILMFCGQRLKNHGIEFRTINVEDVFLKGHRGQIEQALLNLINNSFDAVDSLEEKWIEVTAVKSADMVDIYVIDSGHGIPNDIKNRMLIPFFTTKLNKGTGLGLPLVKGIAQKHGGDLSYVEKAPHTTFLLELPKGVEIH
ncbi:MAG: sensor histidine kinase [Bacteriovoracaceae bacterium]